MDDWFVEEMGPQGEYEPRIYRGKEPKPNSALLPTKNWRNPPVKIPQCLHGETPRIVKAFMSPDGEFSVIPKNEIEYILGEIK